VCDQPCISLDQAIQIAVAVGTVAVAILAIWGDQVRHLFGLGPSLHVLLDDPEGESIAIAEGGGRSTPARYYHVRVKNTHRWSQADNVRVVIVALSRPAADGTLAPEPLSGPLQLMWRFSAFHPNYSTVGPDDIADLGFMKKGKAFILTPFVTPANFRGSLAGSERLQVVVQAIADNAESKPIAIDVSWDGEWRDDATDMAKHLVVKQVKPPDLVKV
jgi:hypothetical protein